MKSYFIDTNVLFDCPSCISKLHDHGENQVYIPYMVLQEIDNLKTNERLRSIASQIVHQINLNRDYITILPKMIKYPTLYECNDDLIIYEIKEYIKLNSISNAIVISNDEIFKIKCSLVNLYVESFKDSSPWKSLSESYTGILDQPKNNFYNYFTWSNDHTPIFHGYNETKRLDYNIKIWKLSPKSIYQKMAMFLLINNDIDVVSIQSSAGYGKSYISLAAAMYLTLEKKKYKKIYITKPLIEVGRSIGYLPGDQEEKVNPYMKYINSLAIKLHDLRPANRLFVDPNKNDFTFNPRKIEILPINYIRGLNIEDAIVIIDEAQNFTRLEMRTILTRMCDNVRCFILGDVNQIDHPQLNSNNNGLNWVVKKFNGLSNYAHLVLKGKHSRGKICDMVLKSGL